ncbi:hypothetical protein [Streptomyces sp. NBC_01601]|uniref:hypothetical protein n=1 Tax=Streptomyces sp. NBC_01601 TaxID=2975892 RepID=UPI002E2ABEBA|nr:hypothetical protein [Streptomyces sp. NBC_01601]
MPTEQHTPPCPVTHYSLPAWCTLRAGHPDTCHQTVHPDTGQTIRFHAANGTQHTQEWVSDDDPEAPDAGEWVTWHYGAPDVAPTPVVPGDLDQRVAALVAGHHPTSRVRPGQAGVESECVCGTWYPMGRHDAHLGREMSLLVRGYFDLGIRYGQERTHLVP